MIVYKEYQSVYVPSSELGPPPLPRMRVCLPPETQTGGDNTRLGMRGWGTQFRRLDRKPGTLYTLYLYAYPNKKRFTALFLFTWLLYFAEHVCIWKSVQKNGCVFYLQKPEEILA